MTWGPLTAPADVGHGRRRSTGHCVRGLVGGRVWRSALDSDESLSFTPAWSTAGGWRPCLLHSDVVYEWRNEFDNAEVNRLHAEGFEHRLLDIDWRTQLDDHSLGWVSARRYGELVGFVNVAWDGGVHAFVLDTVVARSARRAGIGAELVARVARGAGAAGCEWLHVDFEDDLRGFYFDACGFQGTNAGLIQL